MFARTLLILAVATYAEQANILAIIPTPLYSHQVAHQQLWAELSTKGHHVTVVTTCPIKNSSLKNLTEIDLSHIYESVAQKQRKANIFENVLENPFLALSFYRKVQAHLTQLELSHPLLQKLIKNEDGQKFDVIFVEQGWPVLYAFGEVYKCPIIVVSSMDITPYQYGMLGNPVHSVTYPDSLSLQMVPPLNFKQRLLSSLFNTYLYFYSKYVIIPGTDLEIKKIFSKDMPGVYELMSRISVVFVNTNEIFYPIKPLIPSIIMVESGERNTTSEPLPKDLERFIRSATEPVVYFSLGTVLKTNHIREDLLRDIFDVFSELPYKTVLKLDTNITDYDSKKLFVSKWLPQRSILEHPNVKLFVTHGGKLSLDESIFSHVPILGIPFFGDQFANVHRVVAKGIGLHLDYKTVTKQSFKEAVLELLNNPKYRNRVKELSNLARDQPMTGLERAVWWTEYVIRNKGAQHLKSPFIDLPLYQYYLLDVLGFFVVALTLFLFVFVKTLCLSVRLIKFIYPKKKKE